MKTVSVLGATGQTGQRVVEQLEQRGDTVIPIPTASLDDTVLAILGSDAVVYTSTEVRDAPHTAVEAAGIAGVRRFIQVTPVDRRRGIRDPSQDEYFAAKRAADRSLRSSGLDWTIVTPATQPSTEHSDVAAAVIASLDDDRTIGHAWVLTSDGA